MSIKNNLEKIIREIPSTVKLVAVSKTHSVETIIEAYNSEHKIFGENKVQEIISKYELLPKDIEWHFIGHLQTNKVKYIASFISLIHSVDSSKLLQEINKQALKNNRIIDVLLEMYIAKEETKFGLTIEEAGKIIEFQEFNTLMNVRIIGLMGMATYTKDRIQIKSEFKRLKEIFNILKEKYFSKHNFFKHISMGMSNDFNVAINEGSTIIRIGNDIFGSR